MWETVRPQVAALLATLSTLVEVSKAPKISFSGYPSAHVMPSDNTGDYETNAENERTYAFTIRVFNETKSGGIEKSMEALEQVVDQVIDLLDEEDLKPAATRTIGVNIPSKYTFINIFASPSKWGEFPDQDLLMSEITLKVQFSIDVTS